MEMNNPIQNIDLKIPLKTAGAKGLKLSLNFIFLFKISFIFGFLGSARIDLFPKALGPHSHLPLNHPII